MILSLTVDFFGSLNCVVDMFLNFVYYRTATFETVTLTKTYIFFLYFLPMIYFVRYFTICRRHCREMHEAALLSCCPDAMDRLDSGNLRGYQRVGAYVLKKLYALSLILLCYLYPAIRSTLITSVRLDYIMTFFSRMRPAIAKHLYFINFAELEHRYMLMDKVKAFRMSNLKMQAAFQDIPILILKLYIAINTNKWSFGHIICMASTEINIFWTLYKMISPRYGERPLDNFPDQLSMDRWAVKIRENALRLLMIFDFLSCNMLMHIGSKYHSGDFEYRLFWTTSFLIIVSWGALSAIYGNNGRRPRYLLGIFIFLKAISEIVVLASMVLVPFGLSAVIFISFIVKTRLVHFVLG